MNTTGLPPFLRKLSSSLRSRMTGNSRYACALLLSVLLLTAAVTGIAGPLQTARLDMAEETAAMQKKILQYQQFRQEPDRREKYFRQQIALRKLQGLLPTEPNAEQIARQLYKKAEYNGVAIRKLKHLPIQRTATAASGLPAKKQINTTTQTQTTTQAKATAQTKTTAKSMLTLRPLAWETECTGTWDDLADFIKDIEQQEPLTRLSNVQIAHTRNSRRLSLQGVVRVYSVAEP